VREDRVRTVSLDELDSYFDEMKAKGAEMLSPRRRAGL
jgi:hypothetical protein